MDKHTPVRPTKASNNNGKAKSPVANATAKPTTSSPVAKDSNPAAAAKAPTSTAAAASQPASGGGRPRPGKRDPDCTLVIKNIADGTTQAQILSLFEPLAGKTNTKVVSTTVSAHKAIAFVDYDSPAPVLLAIEQHAKQAYMLHERTLDIYQKTVEQRSRRGSGGGRGGGKDKDNSGSFRGGGGRQQYRRGGGRGGGDRGGGGRGGRGGR